MFTRESFKRFDFFMITKSSVYSFSCFLLFLKLEIFHKNINISRKYLPEMECVLLMPTYLQKKESCWKLAINNILCYILFYRFCCSFHFPNLVIFGRISKVFLNIHFPCKQNNCCKLQITAVPTTLIHNFPNFNSFNIFSISSFYLGINDVLLFHYSNQQWMCLVIFSGTARKIQKKFQTKNIFNSKMFPASELQTTNWLIYIYMLLPFCSKIIKWQRFSYSCIASTYILLFSRYLSEKGTQLIYLEQFHSNTHSWKYFSV